MSARKLKRQPKAQTVIQANSAVRYAHALFGFQPVPEQSWHYLPIAGTQPLKPCPFCSEEATVSLIPKGNGFWAQVRCQGCGIHGPQADDGVEGEDHTIHGLIVEAARMWNARGKKWGAS